MCPGSHPGGHRKADCSTEAALGRWWGEEAGEGYMSNDEACKFLSIACAAYKGTWADHQTLQEALRTVRIPEDKDEQATEAEQ